MNVKHFVGLVLKDTGPEIQRLDEFRRRFDPKSHTNSYLHVSLLPPFILEERFVKNIVKDIEDEIDTYLGEDSQANVLEFVKLDIYNYKKRILYLEPLFHPDLEHLRDGLQSELFELIPNYKKRALKSKCFFTLGRFHNPWELNLAIDKALDELELPMEVKIDSIALFEHRDGVWQIKYKLYEFEQYVNPFLEEKILY